MNNLQVIERNNERVLTTQQLADVYETDSRNISNNFNNNKDKFIEGKHYFLLQGDDLKNFKGIHTEYENLKFASKMYLWTERGANRHCKILDTDKAWEQFDNLEETYFKVKESEQPKLPTTYKEALQHLIEQVEVNEKLQLEGKMKDQVIKELKPKADYTDMILKNKGLVTITQIAKDYGMSGKEMNKILHERGIQYKQSGQWLLYKQHQGKGYTHSETIDITRSDGMTDVKMTTKWTQKGRLFLYDLLKVNNILPDIEKEYSYQTSMLG
ncbi:TPA: phage antirepressor KilAC domain-containing protein [Clostridioides difficile]|uniref:phage antirepressor KilAC domain-containing protein n=11 Tax=Clostridioides difficile TaxID=1496 RepID=UPI00038D9083|nr:phage antirepressor KilAC domain-containing protein [Clostridioides difficile]HDN2471185.1 phage antirepressor KilAC domain-containing protein [Clostridioides difficile CD196]EGT4059185.1 Rha family transcriptional regulator [Clostridioides difficile]EGT4170812.1 Rha family transcriptional regulator [Clostridioides difficile]EGT4539992.1 Rha family transcriptional regulator [Clostridioides difficile]EGT4590903.1 Rha family transcriptional regulator [Clostridioides difficile]